MSSLNQLIAIAVILLFVIAVTSGDNDNNKPKSTV